MRGAFGMRVIGFDTRFSDPSGLFEPVPLEQLFAEADVITLHAPSTPETRRMVGARLLERMKPGSVLINERVSAAAL
jgi:phosphoglycerate dehydrogenase-like enzyme